MQIIKGVKQGTPEWHAYRSGIITMSEVSPLLVDGRGEGGFGAGAITYMHTLLAEKFTGESEGSFSGNKHTERGHADEEIVKKFYQEKHGYECEDVTIILNHGVGYSPDWMVGANGLFEAKSKLAKLQVGVLLSGEVPAEHIAQLQGGLWVAEKEWIDFLCYSAGMKTFEKRVYRDEKYIRNLAGRCKLFYEIMNEKFEELTR